MGQFQSSDLFQHSYTSTTSSARDEEAGVELEMDLESQAARRRTSSDSPRSRSGRPNGGYNHRDSSDDEGERGSGRERSDSLYFGTRLFSSRSFDDLAAALTSSASNFAFLLTESQPHVHTTKTIKCPVNLNKSSVQLVNTEIEGVYNVQFLFDTTTECRVRLYYCATELPYDRTTNTVRFSPIQLDAPSSSVNIHTPPRRTNVNGSPTSINEVIANAAVEPPQQELSTTPSQFVSGSLASANAAATFGPGLGQLFITNRSSWLDTRVYPHHLLAPSSVPSDKKTVRRRISESGEDEQYEQEDDDSDGKDDTDPYGVPSVIPVAIVLEAILPDHKPRSKHKKDSRITTQVSYATLIKRNDDTFTIKVLKQKIFFKGVSYVVHDIFGIESDPNQQNECVICMTDPRDTLVLPCRHMCLCRQCAELLKFESVKCPICRGPVRSLVVVDISPQFSPNSSLTDMPMPPDTTVAPTAVTEPPAVAGTNEDEIVEVAPEQSRHNE